MAKYEKRFLNSQQRFLNSNFFIPSITSLLLQSKLVHVLTMSSRRILVISEWANMEAAQWKAYYPDTKKFLAKGKESFTVNALNVIDGSLRTKNFKGL